MITAAALASGNLGSASTMILMIFLPRLAPSLSMTPVIPLITPCSRSGISIDSNNSDIKGVAETPRTSTSSVSSYSTSGSFPLSPPFIPLRANASIRTPIAAFSFLDHVNNSFTISCTRGSGTINSLINKRTLSQPSILQIG